MCAGTRVKAHPFQFKVSLDGTFSIQEDVAEVDEDDEFEFNPSFDETEARIAVGDTCWIIRLQCGEFFCGGPFLLRHL